MRIVSLALLFASTFLLLETSTAFVSSGPRGARRSIQPLQAAAKKGAKKADGVITKRKNDIVASVVDQTGMSKVDCEACVAAVLDTIVEEVAAGNKVNIAGFGTFKRSDRKERKGRNPKTGEELLIAAKKAPSFSAGKAFKERVNE